MRTPRSACSRRGHGTGTPSSISRPASCTPWSIPRGTGSTSPNPANDPAGGPLPPAPACRGRAQRGHPAWGYAPGLPHFRRTERRVGEADDTFRGRDGNLPITDLDWRDPICEAFIEGAVQLGIPRNRDYNGTMQGGVSYVHRIIQNGMPKSPPRGYLHPAMKRKNLTVRTNAHATEIVLEGKRAVGVRYRKGGRDGAPVEVRARRELILAGGTVNSPQLLQVSGIGPASLLKSLGIAVKHDLPGVG